MPPPAEAPDPGSPGGSSTSTPSRSSPRPPRAHVQLSRRLTSWRSRSSSPRPRRGCRGRSPVPGRAPSSVDDEPPVLGHRDEEARRVAEACVVEMAGHTLSVGNLRAWLRIAAEARGTARGALVRALDAALRSPRSGGPASFFALGGEGSGVLGASGARSNSHSGFGSGSGSNSSSGWPFNDRGFAFVTWVYLESLRGPSRAAAAAGRRLRRRRRRRREGGAQASDNPPPPPQQPQLPPRGTRRNTCLVCSASSPPNGGKQGVEAYFHGRYLVLEATGENGARASAPFAAPIQLKRWTCVAVEYRPGVAVGGGSSSSASTAAAGEARLYVDGVLAESHPCRSTRVRGSLGFCCVGTNRPRRWLGCKADDDSARCTARWDPRTCFARLSARGASRSSPPEAGATFGYGDVNPPLTPRRSNPKLDAPIFIRVRSTGSAAQSTPATVPAPASGRGAAYFAGSEPPRGRWPQRRRENPPAPRIPGPRARGRQPPASRTAPDAHRARTRTRASLRRRRRSPRRSIAIGARSTTRSRRRCSNCSIRRRFPGRVLARGASRISPRSGGGLGDRRGSTLGNARCARRTPPGDAMLAVAPGGAACAFALACASVCARTRRPSPVRRRLRSPRAATSKETREPSKVRTFGRPFVTMTSRRRGRGPRWCRWRRRSSRPGRAVRGAASDVRCRVSRRWTGGRRWTPRICWRGSLPDALAATRRAYESAGNLDGVDDAEEAAAAGIVAWLDAARDHPPLRRQIASRLILSLETVDRGERYEEGGGARAPRGSFARRAADAHVEGGAEVRRLRGASRLLADARRYLVAGSPPRDGRSVSARGLRPDGNDGRNGGTTTATTIGTTTSNSSERSAVEFERDPGRHGFASRRDMPRGVGVLRGGAGTRRGRKSSRRVGFPSVGSVPPGRDDRDRRRGTLGRVSRRLSRPASRDARGIARARTGRVPQRRTRLRARLGVTTRGCRRRRRGGSFAPPRSSPPRKNQTTRKTASNRGMVTRRRGCAARRRRRRRRWKRACDFWARWRIGGEGSGGGRRGRGRGRGRAGAGGVGATHTLAIAERAVRHCLRRAPRRLLTEGTWDAAFRAALRVAGTGEVAGQRRRGSAPPSESRRRLAPRSSLDRTDHLRVPKRGSRGVASRASVRAPTRAPRRRSRVSCAPTLARTRRRR